MPNLSVLSENNNSNEIKDMLSILTEETLKEVPKVEKIYLFGSYAYGNPTKNSDLDIMVITKDDMEDTITPVANIRYNLWDKVLDFDMIIYSKKTFDYRKEYYKLERKISKEGMLIYGDL